MKSFLWLGCILTLYSCSNHPDAELKYQKVTGATMGTYYAVTWSGDRPTDIKESIDSLLIAFNEEVSTYIPHSTIGRFNERTNGIWLDTLAHSGFWNNFTLAEEWSNRTGGAFEPTIMPLVNYWGFGYTEKKPVTQIDSQRIQELLPLIGWSNIQVSHVDSLNLIWIEKNNPDVQLDFSAIAKGFGVDLIGRWLEGKGIKNYLVDIGGEMRSFGRNPKGLDWVIGINEPIAGAPADAVFQTLKLKGKSVATSGNYRNFYEVDGKQYSHTISPWTGFPQKHALLSVTVVASDCAVADALATACMVVGHELGLAMIEKIADIEAYFIYNNGQDQLSVAMTEGFQVFLND